MSDTIKGVKIKALPEKDTMTDTDILVIEDSEATKQISAEAMKTYFTADLAEQIEKLENENAELSDALYKSVEFYNGDEWLETVVVMRGDDATYTGDTPQSPDGDDYVFTGWEPEPTAVKENVKCYAQYEYDPAEKIAFAFYCEDDNSLNFYADSTMPEEGTVYDGKATTNIYSGFDTETYSRYTELPWFENIKIIITVNFNESFIEIQPVSTACWFCNFSNCTEINGLKYLNTNSVTNMNSMFQNCNSLTALDLNGFNTSSVTNMNGIFCYCRGLTELDVSGFDTSSVTNMSNMFAYCNSLTSLDLNEFDTSLVTNMSGMFFECYGLTALDLSKFDTSSVTNMSSMFDYCRGLTELDVSGFDTNLVANMNAIFANCDNLKTLNLNGFNTASVTSMNSMFGNDINLVSLDLSEFNTSLVTNMTWMFNGSYNLTTIYTNDDLFVTSKVTSSADMFTDCTKLVGGNGTAYNSSKVDVSMAHVDTASNPGYFTAK